MDNQNNRYGAISSSPSQRPESNNGKSNPEKEDEHRLHLLRELSNASLAECLRNEVLNSVEETTELLLSSDEVSIGKKKLDGGECVIERNASIVSEIFTIAKNLVGCGVLSLPNGIALYSSNPSSIYIASFYVFVFGAVFGYFCLLIAKSCEMTNSLTYRGCYQNTVGAKGAGLVALATALVPALANLAYSLILAQALQSLLETIHIEVTELVSLLLVTVFGILPLCLLKNMSALAPSSLLGTVGILVTSFCMIIRAMDGSYRPGGIYHEDLPENLRPDFVNKEDPSSVSNGSIMPFLCMVYTSWAMHYNTPRFYSELIDASIPRFAIAVAGAFGLSGILSVAIAAAGYLTFGGNSDGNILNNYSPQDPLATVCRLLISFGTLMTFPVVFFGFRDGILGVLNITPERQTDRNVNIVTVVLLTIITVLAIVCTDLGMINAVAGGTLGTIVCVIIPALMFRSAVMNQTPTVGSTDHDSMNEEGIPLNERNSGTDTNEQEQMEGREVLFAMILMILGTIVGAAGVWEEIK